MQVGVSEMGVSDRWECLCRWACLRWACLTGGSGNTMTSAMKRT